MLLRGRDAISGTNRIQHQSANGRDAVDRPQRQIQAAPGRRDDHAIVARVETMDAARQHLQRPIRDQLERQFRTARGQSQSRDREMPWSTLSPPEQRLPSLDGRTSAPVSAAPRTCQR